MFDRAQGGLPRFFFDRLPESKGVVVKMNGDEFWHMTKVLRLTQGDRVELFNGRGGITIATIASVGKSSVQLTALGDICTVQPEGGAWHMTAAFATLKGGRADWLVEKCTELGARSLTPLLTERSNVALDRRSTRWQRVILAATKQCQRLHTLELQESLTIHALTKQVTNSKLALLATAGAKPLVEVLNIHNVSNGGILMVGPEGDFTEEEKHMLLTAGAIPVGLGNQRLRVETAAIAMLATVTMVSQASLKHLSMVLEMANGWQLDFIKEYGLYKWISTMRDKIVPNTVTEEVRNHGGKECSYRSL